MSNADDSAVNSDSERLSCSFCGRSSGDVDKLIQGPDACICNDCVSACVATLSSAGWKAHMAGFYQPGAYTCNVCRRATAKGRVWFLRVYPVCVECVKCLSGHLEMRVHQLERKDKSEWKPEVVDEITTIVARELEGCTDAQREALRNVMIPPRCVPIERMGNREIVIAVGRNSSRLLIWDGIESGFEWATVDSDGLIRELGASQFTLSHIGEQLINEDTI